MKYQAARVGLALIAVIVTSTAGCVPFPHRVNTTPWVTGKLESAGRPLANRNVRVVVADAASEACEGPSLQATTNEFGKFVLPPRRRMGWMLAMMAHQRFRWNLCVEVERRWISIKQNSDYTLSDTGPQWLAELRCSIVQDNATLLAHCEEAHTWDHSRSEIEQWLRKP